MKIKGEDLLAAFKAYGWEKDLPCPTCDETLFLKFEMPNRESGIQELTVMTVCESAHLYGTSGECGYEEHPECGILIYSKDHDLGEVDDFEELEEEKCRHCKLRTFAMQSDEDYFFCLNGHKFTVIPNFNGWYEESLPGEVIHGTITLKLKEMAMTELSHAIISLAEVRKAAKEGGYVEVPDGKAGVIDDFTKFRKAIHEWMKKKE